MPHFWPHFWRTFGRFLWRSRYPYRLTDTLKARLCQANPGFSNCGAFRSAFYVLIIP
jgi:hypothetical protein